jgi:integrase
MSSIRKKPGSKFWFACITLPDGRRRQFSTRTENERDAAEVAQRAENAIQRNRGRQGLSTALERIAEDVHGARTVAAVEWLDEWGKRKAREVSQKTADRYRAVANELLASLTVKRLDEITVAHVQAMLRKWLAVHSPANANFKLKVLRVVLAEAWRDGLVPENVAAKVRTVKTEAGSPRRPFTAAEIDLLLAKCDKEWKGLVLLALYTGQRLNDLAELKSASIAAKVLTLRTQKTGRAMTIPIVKTAMDALDLTQERVFPTIWALTKVARSHAFRAILERAGLVTEREHYKGKRSDGKKVLRSTGELTFHCLRHTTNSWLKRAGVADGIVMAIVGHNSKAMSDNYTHIDVETMRAALVKISEKPAQ